MRTLLAWIALLVGMPLVGWIPGWIIEGLPLCVDCR